MNKKTLSNTMAFVLLFGLISMLSDVTKESASSIHGAFLSLLGASAATIGFISGLGELVGNSLRYLTGILADRTKKYWTLVIIGSVMELAAVPLLALLSEDGWIYACILLIVQKLGKAVKKPAKDTIASFAAADAGAGKTFGMMELLDQFGSVLGPAMLTLIMLFKTDGSTFERYSYCFGMLTIPAALTMLVLLYTCYKYPNPADFEKSKTEGAVPSLKIGRNFLLFIAGTSFFAFGFVNYSIVAMHVSRVYPDEVGPDLLPLLYSGAMLIDALAAVVFGVLYDKYGSKILVLSAILSAPFALLIFLGHSLPALFLGIGMWGVGMGAQESILKAVVTQMTPKESRATSFGLFSVAFGFAWFLGSWTLGWLYDTDILLMIIISVLAQILAIPFYVMSGKKSRL